MTTKKADNKKFFCDQVSSYTRDILEAKCIFIHGVDAFQRDSCFTYIFQTLKKSFLSDPTVGLNDGMNTFLFYGDEYSTESRIASIIDTLNMISFDLSERIVSIRYFEQVGKDAASKIAKYIENPNPTSKLILVSDKVDTRISAYKTIINNCLHIETTELKYPKDLMLWLNNYLRENKINMDEKAKQFFVNITDIDAFTAHNELKKLELYVNNSGFHNNNNQTKTITINDIKDCTINTKTYPAYDLTDAIGYRQKDKALIIAENLIENGESVIMLISLLTNFFFNLWKWDALRKKGVSMDEVMAKHMGNLHPFIKEKNVKHLNAFNQKQITNALKHLYICDCRAKLSMAQEKVLATSLVMEILK